MAELTKRFKQSRFTNYMKKNIIKRDNSCDIIKIQCSSLNSVFSLCYSNSSTISHGKSLYGIESVTDSVSVSVFKAS